MISVLLAVFGFFVLLPMIIWGILHEEELIAFEDRVFTRK